MIMADLASDYVAGNANLRGFFDRVMGEWSAAPPFEPECDALLLDGINAYQESIGSSARMTNGPCIITGQQPGLLTGPLYTVLKAITVIRMAREFGEKSIPVFWIASDDHD